MEKVSDVPYIPARPTLYKGIQMRSRLEADFAGMIDRQGWEWAYEPECFASEGGQWLPDFRIMAKDGNPIYVEVKPFGFLAAWGDECQTRVETLMRQVEIARQTIPKCHLWLCFWGYGEEGVSMLIASRAVGKWEVSAHGLPVHLQWPVQIGDNGAS